MTTTLFPASSLRECPRPQAGSEREVVARLISNVAGDGVRVDPAWIVNCYVAFKSTPLTILAGPEQCGKALMVHNLAQMLTQDVLRNQMMLGHAWWAEGNQAAALFMEAQTRWNASKVLALMEEASLPENSGYIFIGWLNRISPAELAGYLSELAFQLQHQRLVRPPSLHLAEPIACPPNFSLLGTMDTRPIYGLDETLLSETTIIPWPALEMGPAAGRQPAGPPIPDAEGLVLRSSIRGEKAAFDKLHRVRGWRPQQMWPLCVVEDLLRRHQVMLPECALGQAMIYAANAWSVNGEGLFDPAPGRNLSIAMDFIIMQSLLMRASAAIRDSAALCSRLTVTLSGRFPHSMAFLQSLADDERTQTEVPRRQVPQAPEYKSQGRTGVLSPLVKGPVEAGSLGG